LKGYIGPVGPNFWLISPIFKKTNCKCIGGFQNARKTKTKNKVRNLLLSSACKSSLLHSKDIEIFENK
jgi:hypothetical protein